MDGLRERELCLSKQRRSKALLSPQRPSTFANRRSASDFVCRLNLQEPSDFPILPLARRNGLISTPFHRGHDGIADKFEKCVFRDWHSDSTMARSAVLMRLASCASVHHCHRAVRLFQASAKLGPVPSTRILGTSRSAK